jgi:vacuolar-type H+-ATPase subunit H
LREKESDLEAYEAELRNSSLRDEAGESAFAAKQAELNRQRLQMHEKLDAILQSNSQYHHQIKSRAQKQATASQSLRQCEATVRGESASIHC